MRRAAQWAGGYPLAAAAVIGAALLLLPLRPILEPPTLMLVFVPVIILIARAFGVGVSAMAAVLAFLAIDFLFLEPYYRLVVGSLPEWLGLMAFLVVALVAGQQTGLLRKRELAATRRQAELELLNALSSRIASAGSTREIAEFAVAQAHEVLGASRAAIYVPPEGLALPECIASAGDAQPSPGEQACSARVMRVTEELEAGETTRPSESDGGHPSCEDGSGRVYMPLETPLGVEGVLHVVQSEYDVRTDRPDPSLLESMANLVAASFQRQRLEEIAARTEALSEADRLKTTLVSSVSHELKTPLAAALARVTGLLDEAAVAPERMHAELTEVAEDLARLDGSIGSLLEVSRLESDAWRPTFELHEISEVLGTVVARLPTTQRDRVRFVLDPAAPLISCDFAQLARALANVVGNALAYSPSDSLVWVKTRTAGGEVIVSVEDAGPGVCESERESVFAKFYRGAASSRMPGGTGLGLAITTEIVRSHGGRIWVEDAEPCGARFLIALPVAREAEES